MSFTNPKAKEKLLVVEFHFGELDQSLCRRKYFSGLQRPVYYKVITRVPEGVDVLFRMNELRELRFRALKPHCIGGVLGSHINVFKVLFDI